jgi:hypothetical protein
MHALSMAGRGFAGQNFPPSPPCFFIVTDLGTRDWLPEPRHPWSRDGIFWLQAQGFAK